MLCSVFRQNDEIWTTSEPASALRNSEEMKPNEPSTNLVPIIKERKMNIHVS